MCTVQAVQTTEFVTVMVVVWVYVSFTCETLYMVVCCGQLAQFTSVQVCVKAVFFSVPFFKHARLSFLKTYQSFNESVV